MGPVKDTVGITPFIRPEQNPRSADVPGLVDGHPTKHRRYTVHDSSPRVQWLAAHMAAKEPH